MKKVISIMLAIVMVVTMMPANVFAAGGTEPATGTPLADGIYNATATMMHEKNDKASMCDIMFDKNADITVKDGNATIKLLVANPVPGFPDQGADGTVKDFKLSYDGKQYAATSELNTGVKMTAKGSNSGFGFEEGKQYAAQVLTVTLPAAAISEGVLIPTTAYVNVVMMTNVNFRLKLTDVKQMADYSKVDAALAKIPSDLSIYTAETVVKVNAAKDAVKRGFEFAKQNEVDKMAMAIEEAVNGLKKIEFLKDGVYKATAAMMHERNNQPSMCDIMFDKNADITVKDGNATLKLLVANPVPGFADQGKDGTVKDVKLSYDGKQYTATSELNTGAKMTAKASNPVFGFEEGKQYAAQVLTVTLPAKALYDGALIKTDAFVNVVMMTNVTFRLAIKQVVPVKPEKVKNVKVKTDNGLFKVTFNKVVDADKYVIAIRQAGKDEWRYINVKNNSFVVKQLYKKPVVKNGKYFVKVAAINEAGRGDYTVAKTIYANRIGTKSAKMFAPKFVSIKGNKVVAKKVYVKNTPKKLQYKVSYKLNGTKVWKSAGYSVKNVKYIKGLKKGRVYNFALRYRYQSSVDNQTYVYSKVVYKNVRVK